MTEVCEGWRVERKEGKEENRVGGIKGKMERKREKWRDGWNGEGMRMNMKPYDTNR